MAEPLKHNRRPPTGEEGRETQPALSPDGCVVYSRVSTGSGAMVTAAREVGTDRETVLPITGGFSWLPDGRHIGFVRHDTNEDTLCTIDKNGTGEQAILKAGSRTDIAGACFQFDVTNLQSATTYELQLLDAEGGKLCDPWQLKTHPVPGGEVDHAQILAYTCGRGFDGPLLHGQTFWLDVPARRRLLARGLAFQPEVVISNGDQIY